RRKGVSMQQLVGHGAAPAIAPARGRRSGATARNRTAGLHARQRGSAGLAPYGAWRGRMQWAIGLLLLLALLPVLAQPAPAANADPSSRTVLVMGDSLSAGYGMAARQGWVSLLGERLAREKPGWRVVNASISGETTAGGASRIVGEVLRHRPDVVVIALGANDGLRGLPLREARRN